MGKKTIEISFVKVRSLKDGLAMRIYSYKWMKKHGLDNQKPIYITPDYIKKVYYIEGWEIEYDEETKDKCECGEGEG